MFYQPTGTTFRPVKVSLAQPEGLVCRMGHHIGKSTSKLFISSSEITCYLGLILIKLLEVYFQFCFL
jgi:hypothetical protein